MSKAKKNHQKAVELNATIYIPDNENADSVSDQFLAWIESKGWQTTNIVSNAEGTAPPPPLPPHP